jgi:predicted O-methyltransferase YrrM
MQFSTHFKDWLVSQGNPLSVPSNYLDPQDFSGFPPNFAIQQNEQEILELVGVFQKSNCQNILEIGLGYYGSTHILFREYFRTVTTVEISMERARSFYTQANLHFGPEFFSGKKSSLIVADSNSPNAAKKLIQALEHLPFSSFDALFIDGLHTYDNVMLDFLIYSNFVKRSGIIAFHDILNPIENSGSPRFVSDLRTGKVPSTLSNYTEILHSKSLGIAYFTKD